MSSSTATESRSIQPPNTELVPDGGWLLPGLVDVQTDMGSEQPSDGLDEQVLRRHAEAHRDAGVTLVRSPGAADFYPAWRTDPRC